VLALGEQEGLPSAGAPTSPSPRSVEAPQNEIHGGERSEITSIRPQELHGPLYGTGRGLEWERQETEIVEAVVVEGGGEAIQERKKPSVQKDKPKQPSVGDQRDLAEVADADDRKDKKATKALPATQPNTPEISEHRFRLRGIRTRQLAEGQAKTTQYRVVWGEHPSRSDSWVNEDDVQISRTITLRSFLSIFDVPGEQRL
jgi:hypothetical protein